MHARSNDKARRRAFIAGSIALLAVIIVLVAVLISSCNGSGRFDRYYQEGAEAYSAGDYEAAAEALNRALEYGDSEDCYVLLANTYYAGLGDIDKAIEILYVGSYKLDSETINSYLESLKQIKAGDEDDSSTVTIGGETISLDVTSLVLSQMRLQNSDILPLAQLTQLESLSLTDNGLSDVAVLAQLTELRFLQLGNNQIVDISPLSGLANLRTLYLDGNPIQDFTPLYSLSSLTTLSINNTGISDEQLAELEEALPGCSIHCGERTESDEPEEITLGDVTFMSDVTELDLSNQGLEDISELQKCTELQKLDLSGNNIDDITSIMDLSQLTWLDISGNDIDDILPLMGLSGLEYLSAENNGIEDITAVSALPALKELYLSYNQISDFEPLKRLTGIERLGLNGTGLTDDALDYLAGCTGLKSLAIEDNAALSGGAVDDLKAALPNCNITHSELKYFANLGGTQFDSDAETITVSGSAVTTLAGLENFDALRTLQLTNTSVTDLSQLSGLENLEILEVWSSDASKHGALSDLSPISGLTSLRQLNLMFNNISDISALANLTSLRELHLDGNPVSSLAPLSNLTALESLSLQSCGISDVSALSGLTSLRELYLDSNNISDLTPLVELDSLVYLYINGNNVTADQIRELQAALPNCTVYTDVDLTVPEETPAPDETDLQAEPPADAETSAAKFGMTDVFDITRPEDEA